MSLWNQTQYQESLEILLHKIFPRHNILSNIRKHVSTDFVSNKNFEVDVCVPELNLCFEFQDFYHYKPSWYHQTPLNLVQQKDDTKRARLISELQTLIAIPCWWSGDSASLQKTIQFQRPDLLELPHSYLEIASNPPVVFFEENTNNCQLMLASFPGGPNLNVMERGSWWVGEKWDGIRCFWDSTEKQLYSRNRMVIELQADADHLLGNVVFDAELWCGRGFFEESQIFIVTFLKTNMAFMRLLCFDEASLEGQNHPFEARYALMLAHAPTDHPLAINAPRFWCEREAELHNAIHAVTIEGGEGIVMRKPLSRYLPGRSDSLFKMKASYEHSDQEALVTKVEEDGSLILQLPNGFSFQVDKNSCILRRQAVRGDVVTFRVDLESPVWYRPFQKLAIQGVLLNPLAKPVVYRIRTDIDWDDVLQSDTSLPVYIPEMLPPIDPSVKPGKSMTDRRTVLDNFAASQGMDELNPVFWHNVSRFKIKEFYKGFHNGGKLSDIILQLYPDIGLQRKQFKVNPQSWKREKARRHLFDKFANSKGMDPLNPIFWYNTTSRDIIQFDKGYKRIARGYGGKLSTILVRLYPSIGLQRSRFKEKQSWKQSHTQKTLFDKFATSKGMDSLNPIFWRTVQPYELIQFDRGGYRSIAASYGGKLSSILSQLYPSICARPQYQL